MLLKQNRKFMLMLLYAAVCLQEYVEGRSAIKTADLAPNDEISDIIYAKTTSSSEQNEELSSYEDRRNAIIEEEQLLVTGGHLELSEKELKAHQILMRAKLLELTKGFENNEILAPSMHFFKAKPLIEESLVFKFVQAMPKGAILHMHNTAAVSSKWVIGNLTYQPGMKKCLSTDNVVWLTFREHPDNDGCRKPFVDLADEREKWGSQKNYDRVLEASINLKTKYPEVTYNTLDKVWSKFDNMFGTIGDAIQYLPAYKAFHWRALEEMYEDNIMYSELRMNPKEVYDDNNVIISNVDAVQILIDLVEEFKKSHKNFLGIKLIYATYRGVDRDSIRERFEIFKELHAKYPNFVVGFDLVGQEDKGKSLHHFVSVLQDKPKTAKFFFHAGETNWYGSTIDLNILDAILMNTTRIGHGYALMKHPILSKAVKERDIGIEVSPLSNQVLNLVWDLRNHPAGYFMSQNIPLVIANDDPGFWDAKGLSYDFYYAIMSFAPNNAGLKTLKHLVWSSIKYSALNEKEKEAAYKTLQRTWNEFIERVLAGDII